MSDIVDRLRAPLSVMQCGERDMPDGSRQRFWLVALEAADTIDALRAENEKLRAALEMFACDCEGNAICLGNCMHRNARAALGEEPTSASPAAPPRS